VLTYVIDPTTSSIAAISRSRRRRGSSRGHGRAGPNDEYLYNTAAHLAELGSPMPISTGWRRGCGA
jgi:cation transport protein ChaC